MNCEDLYEGEDINGESTFYVDKNCTIQYTGHVKDYFRSNLSWECDIVEGLQDGIEKQYYEYFLYSHPSHCSDVKKSVRC